MGLANSVLLEVSLPVERYSRVTKDVVGLISGVVFFASLDVAGVSSVTEVSVELVNCLCFNVRSEAERNTLSDCSAPGDAMLAPPERVCMVPDVCSADVKKSDVRTSTIPEDSTRSIVVKGTPGFSDFITGSGWQPLGPLQQKVSVESDAVTARPAATK